MNNNFLQLQAVPAGTLPPMPGVHQRNVSSFFMMKYPVTQRVWSQHMENNPSIQKGNDIPVHNVTYAEVQKFIALMNQSTGKTFRLPTSAEWLWVAMGADPNNERDLYESYAKGKPFFSLYVTGAAWTARLLGAKMPSIYTSERSEAPSGFARLGICHICGIVSHFTSTFVENGPDIVTTHGGSFDMPLVGTLLPSISFQDVKERNKFTGFRLVC